MYTKDGAWATSATPLPMWGVDGSGMVPRPNMVSVSRDRPSYLTIRHGVELERIAHANRDQDGCGEQLCAVLEKEEREWKGGDMGLGGFKDGVDDDHCRDVEEAEREVSFEVVRWGQLVISPL